MAADAPTDSLVEERDAELVSFNGPQQPIKRKGLFLNPTSSNAPNASLHPPPNAIFSGTPKTPKYHPEFRWWADPQPQWPLWIEKLKPRYRKIWLKAGIHHAIMASRLKIRRDPPSLFGVARFWSKETSTFIFPWAEATLTLEDVMILGGFPVLGEPVRVKEPLGGVIGHMVSKMMAELNYFKKNCPKADQSSWIKHYLQVGKGDEMEHIAFLSLWLSRFVLIADNGKAIRPSVLQVAVRLARGTRIALAPAVLASIYRDLRVVRDHISTNPSSPLAVWSPINILQIWVWERFQSLSPDVGNLFHPGVLRSARWRMTGKAYDSPSVMRVLESHDEFQWRPYEAELRNWCKPSYYRNEGGWFSCKVTQDEELLSFAQCLRACELVGLDCIEQYQPHRVAMQFALDQDIPNSLPRVNSTWEAAWKTYDMSLKNVKFYVPSRRFKSAVTLQYSKWWRNTKKKDIPPGKKRKETQPFPSSKNKKVKGFNEIEISACPVLRHASNMSAFSKSQEQLACTAKPVHTEHNQPLESSETMIQNVDVARESDTASEERQKEELGHASFNEEGITEVVKKTNASVTEEGITEVVKKASNTSVFSKSQEQQACTMKPVHTEFNQPLESSETMIQNLDVTRGNDMTSEKPQKEELGHAFVNEEAVAEVVKNTNACVTGEGITEIIEKTSNTSVCSKLRACTMKPVHTELNQPLENSETMIQNLDVTRENDMACGKQQKEELGHASINEEWITVAVKTKNASVTEQGITEVDKKANAADHDDLTATEKSKEENEKQLEEEPTPEPLDANEEEIMKYPVNLSARKFDDEQTIAEKTESKRKREEAKEIEERDPARKKELEGEPKRKREEVKEIEERDPMRKKELERDLKINQLKEEIASIVAQIRYLESLDEAILDPN